MSIKKGFYILCFCFCLCVCMSFSSLVSHAEDVAQQSDDVEMYTISYLNTVQTSDSLDVYRYAYELYPTSGYEIVALQIDSIYHRYDFYSKKTFRAVSVGRDGINQPKETYVSASGEKALTLYMASGGFRPSPFSYELFDSSMIIFSDIKDILHYFNTGEVQNAVYEPVPPVQYDGENIYLDNFKATFYDSNDLEQVKYKFTWDLPEHLDSEFVEIQVDDQYFITIDALNGADQVVNYSYANNPGITYSSHDDDLQHFNIEKGYVGDYYRTRSVYQWVCFDRPFWLSEFFHDNKRSVLGSDSVINVSEFGLGFDYTLYRVTSSKVQFRITIIYDGVIGCSYYASFDFINHKNDFYTTTPDNYGSPTFSEPSSFPSLNVGAAVDAVGNTHYTYTDDNGNVTDAYGTVINVDIPNSYNIYFHDDDLYYDISPEDYNGVIDNMKTLTDFSKDNKSTYGFLHDIYDALPRPLVLLMASGLSGIIIISFIRILRG